jgi:membrane fusion protein (multidrug efflux system)
MADRTESIADPGRDHELECEQDRGRSRADAVPRERSPHADADAATEPGDTEREKVDEQPKRTRWRLLALAVFVVFALIGGTAYWYLTKDQEGTDDAYTDGRAVIVSSHVAGYVTVLAVNDNQFVHQSDLLVQIEPKDYEAARDQAEGQLKALEAQADNARLGLDKARVVYPAQLSQAEG